MPIRRAVGGTWFYRCLECRATGHDFATDDDALDAMLTHWSSSGCIQDGTVTQPTAPAHDHLGRNCPPSCPAHGHQPIVQDHPDGSGA